MSVHCVSQEMRISGVVVVEKDGTAQKNARHCIGKKEVTNENADDGFRLLQTKLGMTVW